MTIISGSILAANHAHLARDVTRAEKLGIERFHIDVTDGHYTHNLIFGNQVVEDLKKETKALLDVHLATYNLMSLAKQYAKSGADILTFQYETCNHPLRLINFIKEMGVKPAICFTPSTPYEAIDFFIEEVDIINLLAVEPGVGGQRFNGKIFSKIEKISEERKSRNKNLLISVDGGVNQNNIEMLVGSGVDILVIGSGVFQGNMEKNLEELKKIIS